MRLYLVTWPDGERNLVLARDEVDLYLLLDEEADPFSAEIQEIDLLSLPALKIVIADLATTDGLPIMREFKLDPQILTKAYPASESDKSLSTGSSPCPVNLGKNAGLAKNAVPLSK